MSDPPPGAVLMTNSTGRVGWTAVAAVPVPPGAGLAPPPGAQAAAVSSRAVASARTRVDRIIARDTSLMRHTPRRSEKVTAGGLTAANRVTIAKDRRHGACGQSCQRTRPGLYSGQGVVDW